MATTFTQQPHTSQIALLHRVSNIVSSELSLDEMLGQIVGLTVQVTECDACLVYLIENATHEIVLRASQVPHAEDLGHLRMKMGEGITGWVAEHKSVVALAADAAADVRFKYFQALIEDTYEAFASVPLVSGGEIVGVVNVHHREIHQHSPEEIALLTFIVVERAKGILQHRYSLTEEEAYLRLRNESRRLRRPMKDLAEAIILAEDLHRKGETA